MNDTVSEICPSRCLPAPVGEGIGVGSVIYKEGDGRCRVWTKKLTPPPAPKPHPYPLSNGRGGFRYQ